MKNKKIIKTRILIFAFCAALIPTFAQTVEIKGKAIITEVGSATEDAQVLAWETDGTISVVSNSSTPMIALGDFVQGGIVFWLSNDGTHGKVVALSNVDFRTWSNVINQQATSSFIGYTGPGLTLQIVEQSGHTNSAAAKALSYFYAGTDDCYLPTSIEALQVSNVNNLGTINSAITLHGGNIITQYWTSTESSVSSAYYMSENSSLVIIPKNYSSIVRGQFI